MKESIASAPAETWNQRNLPSDIERLEQSPGPTQDIIEHLPTAAMGLARRHAGVFILTVVGILGLVWYFSKRN